ncbi:hypothetical protein M8C21_002023 [Ambrosia artemisiifolia]|uniref:TF-B3 domain-containing protein n=1 Tax=Ambrosia artemisiifolia TaxID=4212 RepID=A0AAD5CVD3_AMBAR|nr:hypothetical protein M8C21_002023 [Ambrosia artemisiifolia]
MTDPPNQFFKFIPPGFKFNLSIPKAFLAKLDGWRDKKAILRRGRHKWPVHIGNGGVFSDGWMKFVAENGVQEFDIIVFKHQGDMVFDFFVFDPSGCERQYPYLPDHVEEVILESDALHIPERSKMLKKRKRTDYSSQSKDKQCLRVDDDSCFVTIMTPYNITSSRLTVPMKFARLNGLTTKKMHTQIVLVDEAKRTCPAMLHIRTDQIRLRDLGKKTDIQVQVKKESRSTMKIKKMTDSNLGNHPYFILTMKPSYRDWGLVGDDYKFVLLENEKGKPPIMNVSLRFN